MDNRAHFFGIASGLMRESPRQAPIVELRFFGGLSIEETSEIVGLWQATVTREWATARLWLQRENEPEGLA